MKAKFILWQGLMHELWSRVRGKGGVRVSVTDGDLTKAVEEPGRGRVGSFEESKGEGRDFIGIKVTKPF